MRCWLPAGGGLLYTAGWRGEQLVHRVMLDGGGAPAKRDHAPIAPSAVPRGAPFVSAFDMGPDGSVAFIAGTIDNPSDLFLRQPDGRERRLTTINARLLDRRRITPVEEIVYATPDGQEAQGWLLRPPDFDPGASYPLAVYI